MAVEGRRESRGSKIATRRKLLLRVSLLSLPCKARRHPKLTWPTLQLRTALQELYDSPPSVTGFDLMVQLKELQKEQVRVLTATMVEPETRDELDAEPAEREQNEKGGSIVAEETVEGEEEINRASARAQDEETGSTEAEREEQREVSAPRSAEDEEMLPLD